MKLQHDDHGASTMLRLSTSSIRQSARIGTIAASALSALMFSTALTASNGIAQENTGSETRVRFDGTTTKILEEPLFVANQILVQTRPGTDVVDLINTYITDTPDAPRPTVQKITSNGTFFKLSYTAPEGEAQQNATGIQALISENDPRASALPGTQLIDAIQNSPDVISASRNYIVHIAQNDDVINDIIGGGNGKTTTPNYSGGGEPVFPNDTNYKVQWHLKLNNPEHGDTTSPGGSNFPAMWARTQGAENVVVAVVDSGIVASHPDIDFAKNILPGYDFVSQAVEFADDGTPGYDNDPTEPQSAQIVRACPQGTADSGWHGTHVAGIAGAAAANNGNGIAGGAWNIKILPVRALSKCGAGTRLDIAIGVYWAAGISIEGVPDNPNPADIINMSLSGLAPNGCDPLYQRAIDAATEKGVTVIVAAGNSGSDAASRSPANCKNVISVAASDARGHMTNYSNFGNLIDIMAPGGATDRDDNGDGQPDGILSTIDADFTYYQGTSMASPLVAAAAALLKSENPNLKPGDIRQILKDNAIPRDATQCPKSCGAGLLNVNVPR